MNKRIRELFEQHTVSAFFVGTDFDLSKNSKGEYKNSTLEDHWQTFQEAAELIVRECAGVCDDERDSTDSEFGKLVAESCALKIMDRFGVEE